MIYSNLNELHDIFILLYKNEPCHENQSNWISNHVLLLQKPGCTATEDGCRFKIMDVFIIYEAKIKTL